MRFRDVLGGQVEGISRMEILTNVEMAGAKCAGNGPCAGLGRMLAELDHPPRWLTEFRRGEVLLS